MIESSLVLDASSPYILSGGSVTITGHFDEGPIRFHRLQVTYGDHWGTFHIIDLKINNVSQFADCPEGVPAKDLASWLERRHLDVLRSGSDCVMRVWNRGKEAAPFRVELYGDVRITELEMEVDRLQTVITREYARLRDGEYADFGAVRGGIQHVKAAAADRAKRVVKQWPNDPIVWDREVVEPGRGHARIQWKGTNVCMDVRCECGADQAHVDAGFAYFYHCVACTRTFALAATVRLYAVSDEEVLKYGSSAVREDKGLHT